MRSHVVILGSGVIGLTTAIVLRDNGFRVTVLGELPPERSTSAVAGATWFPYKVEPPELAIRWAKASRKVFDELTDDPETGVRQRECRQFWREQQSVPWWADAVPDLHGLPDSALPPGFVDSFVFEQPVIEMPRYLRYLRDRLDEEPRQLRVNTLEEAAEFGEILVNCTGLGAGALTGDQRVYPIRGQVMRVANPGIERVLADFDRPGAEAYIIPHEDNCVLGGTAEFGEWELTPRPDEAERIRERCAELDPRIAEAPVFGTELGLRPARDGGVRLETDRLPNGRPCVHNYGHGGAGVTLSWGCAQDVLEVLES